MFYLLNTIIVKFLSHGVNKSKKITSTSFEKYFNNHLCVTLCLACPDAIGGVFVAKTYGNTDEKIHNAVRIETPPKIDGVMDEDVWIDAPVASMSE